MKRICRKIAVAAVGLVLAGSLLTGCDLKNQGEKKVKFVNIERVMQESGLGQQQQERLKAVNEKLQHGLKMAQANGMMLPEDQRQKAMLADQQMLNMEWQKEQNKSNAAVLKAIAEASEQFRKENNLLAIMPATLAYDPQADITNEIIAKLKTTVVDFGALPDIGTKAAGKQVP